MGTESLPAASQHLRTSLSATGELFSTLEQLPGYQRATANQQLLLKTSIYMSQRAFRLTDPVSAARVIKRNGEAMIAPQALGAGGAYVLEQQMMWPNICFSAAELFEEARVLDQGEIAKRLGERDLLFGRRTTEHFFTGFIEVSSAAHLPSEDEVYPYMLKLRGVPEYAVPGQRLADLHACVVLGSNSSGDKVVWEKNGPGGEYKLSTLTEVIARYPGAGLAWRPTRIITL